MGRVVVDVDHPPQQCEGEVVQGECCALLGIRIALLHDAGERAPRQTRREVAPEAAEYTLDRSAVFRHTVHRHFPHHAEFLSRHVSLYGKHREPKPGWAWPEDQPPLGFSMFKGRKGSKKVALKLSVSAEIVDERVTAAYEGDDVSIWKIRSNRLGTSELRSQNDLSEFREVVGKTFDAIKDQHGLDVELSVFPAAPTACAIEFGRTWQPKAHPGFRIFDQVRERGFIERHSIN